jgi:hypothetical protein
MKLNEWNGVRGEKLERNIRLLEKQFEACSLSEISELPVHH